VTIEFKDAFISREPTHRLPDEQLTRIASAYRRAKAEPRGWSPLYRVGNEWVPIYERYMADFVAALHEVDIPRLRVLLENFFRKDFSNGLHGLHFEMVNRYMTPGRPISTTDAKAYAVTVQADIERLFLSIPGLDLGDIRVPIVGNPYGYEIGGSFYYGLHFLYFANKMLMLARKPNARIVELGGGYGGLPWAIRQAMPQAKYIDFDLPEVLAISSFYTLSAFPQASIGLFGELDINSDEVNNFDFIFMPNFEIERLSDNWADIGFNSWSLAEMEPGAIANYVGHLCRLTNRYFMHVNHVTHCKLSSDLFPIDFRKFGLLHRVPAMWGKSEARNNYIDEHEFIYEVRFSAALGFCK